MKFTKIDYKNFGPFSDISAELDDRGLVLVQGQNAVSSSADSNGSGKSFLLEGIAWSIFGRTIRGIGPDEVVNNASGKNCSVHTRIDNDGQIIDVIRYRKVKKGGLTLPSGDPGPTGSGVLLFVDENDMTRGTNKETDRLICEMIGMDFETFTQSVYFDGQSIPPFPALTDKEIKSVFETVLGLEDLNTVAAAVKEIRNRFQSERTTKETELTFAESESSSAAVEIHSSETQRANFETQKKDRAKSKRDQAVALAGSAPDLTHIDRQISDLQGKMSDFDSKLAKFTVLDAMISRHNDKANTLTINMRQIADTITALEQQRDKVVSMVDPSHQSRLSDASARRRHATRERSKHEDTASNASTKIGTPCGECGKAYDASDLQSIIDHANAHANSLAGEITKIDAEIEGIKGEIEDWRKAAVANFDAQIVEKKSELGALEAQRAPLEDEKTKLSDLTRQKQELADGRSKLPLEIQKLESEKARASDIDRQVELLKSEADAIEKEDNPFVEQIERWKAKRVDADTKISGIEEDIVEIDRKLKLVAILERAYGRAGLKAHILETVTPVLNDRANLYADKLTDGSVDIEFSTLTTNKDGTQSEKFSVTVKNRQGAEAYLGNSSGEKKKINLSIALAMSDLVSARAGKPIDLWVADEIAESLDPTALERVVSLLHDKAKERGTLLTISHTDMTPYISNVWTVRKEAAGSRLM